MSNALAVLNELENGGLAVSDESFKGLIGDQNTYSSRLQLFSFNSGAVTSRKIEAGHFGLVNGETIEDLGEEISCMPLAVRPKAMDLSGDKPNIVYDTTSPAFIDIQSRAKASKESNCMVGVEFLVFLPEKDVFTTFYLANATLLREAQNIKDNLGQLLKVVSKPIKKERYSWHGIVVSLSSVEIETPSKDRILAEFNAFKKAVTGGT